jgi:AraC family transcriptional regulator
MEQKKTKKLLIKNMVCQRCVTAVEAELNKLDLKPVSVLLGEAIVEGDLNDEVLTQLNHNLQQIGFELIGDKKMELIEKIKTEIIHLIHYHKETDGHVNYSLHLSKTLGFDYTYLSNLFSSVTDTTIEKYIINQRIEKVKELLVYDELTLSEIAWQTGYSSVQHLSNQFKKLIGMSPSAYKKMHLNNRKALDQV